MNADFFARVEAALPEMSKGQKKIARFIEENFDKAAFLTAQRLGREVGVSESTVVRFADSLGYYGYPELQHELRETLRTRLTGAERMARTGELSGDPLLEKVLKTDIENIRGTLAQMDRAAFEKAVNAITEAKRVYVMGVRAAQPLAMALSSSLDFIRDDVRLVAAQSADALEQLIHIGSGDLFIGISFPRYSKRTVEAMNFARKRGACCLSLTDSDRSPLSPLSDILMEVRCDTVSFADSLVAPLSVVNALIAAAGQQKKNELSQNLKDMEDVWNTHGFYAHNE